MNWYFLQQCMRMEFFAGSRASGVRDHLLEAVDGGFHLGAVGDIVLDALYEGRFGNSARVRGSVIAPGRSATGIELTVQLTAHL
jgi:hypothetical protein